MLTRHEIPGLTPPLIVRESRNEVRLSLDDASETAFARDELVSLTSRRAEELIGLASNVHSPRRFVRFRRSSPDARRALREAGISYEGEDGYVFLRAPGIYVERGDRELKRLAKSGPVKREGDGVRNPFANRSSRVPRWMLSSSDATFSAGSLAGSVDLNSAAVSRILAALEDAAFLRVVETPQRRGRQRSLELVRSLALLEAWLPVWSRRRTRRWRWDIGARDVDVALDMLRQLDESDEWAIGGLAGAAMVSRVVEPATVTVWASSQGAEMLTAALDPIETSGGRGSLDVALAPDPWILRWPLARPAGGLRVSDPAQLWLDCSSEGERALDAADAIAQVMSWK